MLVRLRCSVLLGKVMELRKLIRSERGLHMPSPQGLQTTCQIFRLGNCYLDYQGYAAQKKRIA